MTATQESLYEHLFPLTTIMKQRVVDNLDGDTLNERWTVTHIGGGSTTMEDAIDDGFKITTGTTLNDSTRVQFGDIRQYAHNASVSICVMKTTTTATAETLVGFNAEVGSPINHFSFAGQITGISTTDYVLLTGDDATSSGTEATFALDTIFHIHQVENGSANIKYSIDGVLEVTKESNRPIAKLQPILWKKTKLASTARIGHYRYYEAFNT